MDWDKLRIFHAVAEAGSFTHAGEALNLSQSAISRQIGALEDTVGVSLFHRHPRGLLLTEQGEMLLETAREIFSRLAEAESRLMDSRDLPEGPLQITVAEFMGSTWLAPLVGKFCAKYPDIDLTMILEDRILNLGMREADVAIRLYKPEQQDLIQRQLCTLQFQVCASAEYLTKRGEPKKPADLASHTLIGYPENVPLPFHDANWLFRLSADESSGGISPSKLKINSLPAILAAAKGGAGIAALPEYMVRAHDELRPIMPDTKPASVEMYFVYPEVRRHSRRIMLFRDFLLEHMAL